METTKIENLVTSQILKGDYLELKGDFDDSIAFYQSLLGNINNLCPIKSFQIGIDTGTKENPDTNITIIIFEDLPKDPHLRNNILQQVYYSSDEYPEAKLFRDQPILVLSFDF